MSNPEPPDAIVWTERARHALDLSLGYSAQANAVLEQTDADDLAGDVRRGVYEHLTACADLYARQNGDYKERARDAPRKRYDTPVPAVTAELVDAIRSAPHHVCTARNCACRRPA